MAFVDIPVFATIRRIARVREWDIIETKNDIIKTHAEDKYKPDKTHLKRVKDFINNYITNFKNFDPKLHHKNSNLLMVLEVLKYILK